MNRITDKHLQAKIDWLNKITGSPSEPYVGGKAQNGCYHLSHAYGGVCLHRMHNESGGVSDVFSCGHSPKRELAGLLDAFIKGITLQQEVTA